MTMADHLIEQGRLEGFEIGRLEGFEIGRREGFEICRQLGIELGKLQGSHDILLNFGSLRFGKPPEEILARLNNLTDHSVIENLIATCLKVESWQDLIDTL